MQDLKVTIVQSSLCWEDRDANLRAFDEKLSGLKGNTDMIILPEMFSTGFSMNCAQCAEEENGPTLQWLKDRSAALGCVITGSIMIYEGERFYNRLYWMRPDGSYDHYDKRHLFRFAGEHLNFNAGGQHLVTELKGWKFRPLVCYDLRFPVWSRNRYDSGNFEYDCLVYVANWPEKRSQHWKELLTARAIENISFCIGVNRVGDDGRGIPHTGDSRIIDPAGTLTSFVDPGKEEVRTVSLQAETLLAWRKAFNVGQDWDNFTIMP
jgi:omega-amidase